MIHPDDRPTLAEAEADDAYCKGGHRPVHFTKEGGTWRNDQGQTFPPTLHRYDCSCGYRGSVWMMSEARAKAIYDRNYNAETGTHR
jgi:hypothetical protein